MIKTFGLRKILNHKINLIGFNYNNQTYRYEHTHSKSIFVSTIDNKNLHKLNSHEHSCFSKILSDDEFNKKVRNIVQEELKKININTNNNNITNNKNITTNSEQNNLFNNIKNIEIEIDKIKKSINNDNL